MWDFIKEFIPSKRKLIFWTIGLVFLTLYVVYLINNLFETVKELKPS